MIWWLLPLLFSTILFAGWFWLLTRHITNRESVLILWVSLVPMGIAIEVLWVGFGQVFAR